MASPENLKRTTVLPERRNFLRRVPKLREVRVALSLFFQRRNYDVVIANGHFPGLLFAGLQRLLPGRRVCTILVDCLWYREPRWWRRTLKKWQMKFCLGSVDRCVVWAEREIKAYGEEFGVDPSKFVYVPHHTTLHPHRYKFSISNGDYVFAGGNGDRDYRTLVEAIRPLNIPCVIACTDDRRLAGIEMPTFVRRVRATHEEFRQLMAGAKIVVVPMEAGHLHSGGQQSFLNAMAVGKAVIVTDPEGGCSYIEHGVTGLLVPAGDVIRLREAVSSLLQEDRRKEISSKAVICAQEYSVENTYNRICLLADQIYRGRLE
jgi:glycosyltransferase involved in cell wall biosynthesis